MGIPVDQAHEPKEPVETLEPAFDDDDEPFMGSTCIHCGRMGEMRLQTRALPCFAEDVMVMAFQCLLCGFKNDEVQFAGQCGPRGVRYTLMIEQGGGPTLARQILKAETATVSIPKMEFEIPGSLVDTALLTRGDLTSVEGLLRSTVANLQMNQAERAPEVAEKIQECIEELQRCANGEEAFELVLDDPTGNSFISPPEGTSPEADLQLKVEQYERTRQQQIGLGLETPPDEA